MAIPAPKLDVEQYLKAERCAQTRHEYLDGEVYAMTGASRRHNLITLNLGAELRAALRQGPCEVYVSDMRVKVEATGLYAYPDVTICCGPPALEDHHRDTLLNPTAIVEVISPSTEAYDRGRKFAHYRQLSSLKAYLLVAQTEARVEHYQRQSENGDWIYSEVTGVDRSVQMPYLSAGGSASVPFTIPLGEIYHRVDLGLGSD